MPCRRLRSFTTVKMTKPILELLAMAASLGSISLAYLLFLSYPPFSHGLMLIPAFRQEFGSSGILAGV